MTPEQTNTAIGQRVSELRKAAGMSQRDLEALSGVARKQIGTIELGTAGTTIKTLRRLADALGCSVRDLCPEEGHIIATLEDISEWDGPEDNRPIDHDRLRANVKEAADG